MPDVLDIVIIFHGGDELLHHDGLLLGKGLVVLGDHLDLGGNENRPQNRELRTFSVAGYESTRRNDLLKKHPFCGRFS